MTEQSDNPSWEIRLGASRSITVRPGSMVIIRKGENDAYGAVIVKIAGCTAWLTFTPEGEERVIPLGMILCSTDAGPATLDLSSVPRYQPNPTVTPYRSRRVQAHV